jgi:hypothetical protein
MCSITIDDSGGLSLQQQQREDVQQFEIDSRNRPLHTHISSKCSAGSGEAAERML